jgi:hypothetical protein
MRKLRVNIVAFCSTIITSAVGISTKPQWFYQAMTFCRMRRIRHTQSSLTMGMYTHMINRPQRDGCSNTLQRGSYRMPLIESELSSIHMALGLLVALSKRRLLR